MQIFFSTDQSSTFLNLPQLYIMSSLYRQFTECGLLLMKAADARKSTLFSFSLSINNKIQ